MTENDDQPSFLKRKSQFLIKQLDIFQTELTPKFITDCDDVRLQIYLDKLESFNSNFDKVQSSLEEENPNEFDSNARSHFSTVYIELKASLTKAINTQRMETIQSSTRQVPNDEAPSICVKYSRSRLPELQLPVFNGTITEWPHFFAMFNTVVNNDTEISRLEKFQHLRSCLKDSALDTIRSLELTDVNYNKALELLTRRFDNKRLIFQAHIRELFGIQSIDSTSVESLRKLTDSLNSHIRALQTMGTKEQLADGLIIHLVSKKLDSESQSKWEERSPVENLPTWDQMASFLDKRCQILENLDFATATVHSKNVNKNISPRTQPNRKSLIAAKSTVTGCTFCDNATHLIYTCSRFGNLSPGLRLKEAKKHGLCINCLKKGHQLQHCKSTSCRVCSGKHHTLLHISPQPCPPVTPSVFSEVSNGSIGSSPNMQSALVSMTPTTAIEENSRHPSNECVLLATAVILIKNRAGSFIPCRAILDSASQLHFVTKSLACQLQLKTTKAATLVSGIGEGEFIANGITELELRSRFNDYSTHVTAVITAKITDQQPSCNIRTCDWNIPKNIQLADPSFHESQRIDVLIGAALFFELLCIGQIRLAPGLPILQKTRLGWVVSGGSQYPAIASSLAAINRSGASIEYDQHLDQLVRKFWETDGCFDAIVKTTKEHLDCEEHFKANYSRLGTGEYSVRLPIKLDTSLLGDSYQQALRRFHALERRLQKNVVLKSQYCAFIKEYLDLKHMSLATDTKPGTSKYFLSHHCVLKEASSTTKLRVVFDGSAATSTGYSLNDVLLSGPTIQPNLFDILIRFRSFPVVLTADICKMYRCVRVSPPDNYLQCILWRDNPQDALKVYKLDTVTYGTKPAAFLSIRVMQQLAADEAETFPIGSKIINRDFYVDDLITGGSSEDEVENIMRQTSTLLNKGNFKLRKWCSNNPAILKGLPESEKEPLLKFDDGSNITKALGLIWDPTCDNFLFSFVPQLNSRRITKRSVLSTIARFYDPLGLIGPVIAKAKIFLQRLWKEKLDWDESLPNDLHSAWITLCKNMDTIQKSIFPRLVLTPGATIELHAFCDASLNAFGVCIYVLSRSNHDKGQAKLLCSKSRVAPLKTLTVPKLELCAAALLAQLVHQISKLNIFNAEIHCWSDSSIVLSWIRGQPSTFNIFVANRVSSIQQMTEGMTWHYVPTEANPADILSKGATPTELLNSPLWHFGPPFLVGNRKDWPKTCLTHSQLPEMRKTILISTSKPADCSVNFKFINSFGKIQRIFGYVHKFITKDRSSNLTLNNIQYGTNILIRMVQKANLWDEYRALERKQSISSSSKLFSLSPFLDNFGLLRVGGRLSNSNLEFNSRHPIILPKHHPLTVSIINHFHRKWLHAGSQALLASIRLQYWPIGGRKLIAHVINKCIVCFRVRPTITKYIMGQLPEDRVQPSRAFVTTGIDFCGPFYYTSEIRNKPAVKCYICLFICFTTKAVHLELVKDLSTPAFLASLQRFICTRGKPKIIWSDNATNFCGAKNELVELKRLFFNQEHREAVRQQCLNDSIEWRFIPPGSPHFGGLWEAAVKTAKYHFYRVAGLAKLNFDELRTLVCTISSIINSRPLLPLSERPEDLEILTPAHFLIGAPFTSIIEPDTTELNINRLDRWQRISFLQQTFWKRWSIEYLTQLQERTKWRATTANLDVGTMVLLKDENLPPLRWALGRVTEVIAGSDGVVRVALVRTRNGIIKRAVSKLCQLPVTDASWNASLPTGGECLGSP